MQFFSVSGALRAFVRILWSGRKDKKQEARTISRITAVLERYRRDESLSQTEHQLLTTAMALRDDLEKVLEIGGWLPPAEQKTLVSLRRALGASDSLSSD